MKDSRIPLRSRGTAAVLAFLLPGAGHLYQGRRFKAAVFSGCILSTFVCGLVLGEGQPVYSQVVHVPGPMRSPAQLHSGRISTEWSLGYYAQVFVGLPALPALVQTWRFSHPSNVPGRVAGAVDEPFAGNLIMTAADGEQSVVRVQGRLRLGPTSGDRTEGVFSGTDAGGSAVELEVDGSVTLGRPVFGAPGRMVRCQVRGNGRFLGGRLDGTISRRFVDWFQAPRDNLELDRLHATLSQRFDIACVFTWIAGLLNVMAIWDAFDGPAYGYGDESDEDDGKSADA